MFQEEITSLESIQEVAKKFLAAHKEETVFAFYGKMGVGKTTFIKTLCEIMGVEDYVTSPTFSLVNEYHTEEDQILFHFDFYRINNIEEAYDFGYEDYFYSGNLCFIEWPELVDSLLPQNTIKVTLTEQENGNRLIQSERLQ